MTPLRSQKTRRETSQENDEGSESMDTLKITKLDDQDPRKLSLSTLS